MVRRLAALGVCLQLQGCPRDEHDPKAEAEGLYLAGQSAYLKGNFAEAHQKFAHVKRLSPMDPRLPAAEGEVYLAEVKLDDALKAFEEASRVDPKRATTWSRLGYIHLLKGHRAEAAEALGKALALNPKDFNALEGRAEIRLKQGKLDEAVVDLLEAAEAAPELARSLLVMRAVSELGRAGRGADALATLEAQVKKGVKSAELMNEYADRLVEANRLEDAKNAYVEAARLNPKDPTLWELVGELRVKLDEPEQAEVAFRESLKIRDRGVVHVALARLCQRKKDEACLKRELDLALATASGEEVRELVDLADLLVSVGRKNDAFALVRDVADEEDSAHDAPLQLKAAQLARELGEKDLVKRYCAHAADAGAARCP